MSKRSVRYAKTVCLGSRSGDRPIHRPTVSRFSNVGRGNELTSSNSDMERLFTSPAFGPSLCSTLISVAYTSNGVVRRPVLFRMFDAILGYLRANHLGNTNEKNGIRSSSLPCSVLRTEANLRGGIVVSTSGILFVYVYVNLRRLFLLAVRKWRFDRNALTVVERREPKRIWITRVSPKNFFKRIKKPILRITRKNPNLRVERTNTKLARRQIRTIESTTKGQQRPSFGPRETKRKDHSRYSFATFIYFER